MRELIHELAHFFGINFSSFQVWIERRQCNGNRNVWGDWQWDTEDLYFVGRKCQRCGQLKGRKHYLGTDFPLAIDEPRILK